MKNDWDIFRKKFKFSGWHGNKGNGDYQKRAQEVSSSRHGRSKGKNKTVGNLRQEVQRHPRESSSEGLLRTVLFIMEAVLSLTLEPSRNRRVQQYCRKWPFLYAMCRAMKSFRLKCCLRRRGPMHSDPVVVVADTRD